MSLVVAAGLMMSAPPVEIVRLPKEIDEAFAAGRADEAFARTAQLVDECLKVHRGETRACTDLRLALAEFAPRAKQLARGELAARQVIADWIDDDPPSPNLALALADLGVIEDSGGKAKDAEKSTRLSLRIFRLIRPAGHNDIFIVADNLLRNLGGQKALDRAGDPIDALTAFLLAASPDAALKARTLLNATSDKLTGLGHYELAERIERSLVTFAERTPDDREWLAFNYVNLGMNLGFQDRNDEALGYFEKGRILREGMLAANPDSPVRMEQMVTLLRQQAVVFNKSGKAAMAETTLRRAMVLLEQLEKHAPGKNASDMVAVLNSLAVSLQDQFLDEQAERYFRIAMTYSRQHFGDDSVDVGRIANNLAGLLKTTSREEDAEGLYRIALANFTKHEGPDHPDTLTVMQNLGVMVSSMGRPSEALPLLQKALSGRQSLSNAISIAITELNIADVLADLKRDREAEPHFLRGRDILAKQLETDHPDRITANSLVGRFYLTNSPGKALTFYREGALGVAMQLAANRDFSAAQLRQLQSRAKIFNGQVRAAWARASEIHP